MGTEITTAAVVQRKVPQPSERRVSAKVAAEFLQMHARSVTRLAGAGHIPGHPIGYGQRKKWLFYISELDEWLRAQICSDASRCRQGKGEQVAETKPLSVRKSRTSQESQGPRRMAIPLLGSTESINDAPLDNFGDSRGLSDPSGCQTCGRRSPTRNQQRVAVVTCPLLSLT